MINPHIENQSESDIFIKSKLPLNQKNQILINKPYIINSIDKKGETLLSYAMNNNNYKLCDLLLNYPKLNIYYKDNYGRNNLIKNEHIVINENKARKLMNENKKSNISTKTLKNNKSEFKLPKYNIKSPKIKNGNDNINNNNQKDNRMMLSKYCKYYKSNPHFLINNKALNEKDRNNILNSILTNRRENKNNINNLKMNLTKDEEGEEISKVDNNNLMNYTSKDTKFITDTKEKSNNFEDISSFVLSQSSESKINYNEKNINYNNKDNNHDLKRKYIIYDTTYITEEKEKEKIYSFEKNNKSCINANKLKTYKFNTIIQKQKNMYNNYKEDNIFKYKISNNQSNKNNLKKGNQTNKKINKTIGITKIKKQNSFNNTINIKNNNNKKEKKNIKIYQILKKRNIKRGEIFNLSQNKNLIMENKNKNNLFLNCNKERNQIDENGLTMNSSKLLKDFLSQIYMDKYIANLAFNGFDDINLILKQSKNGNSSIQDSELKEAGIKIPGDRAKILIRIQELSNNFGFPIPKEVYYSIKNNKNILDDKKIIKLKKWTRMLAFTTLMPRTSWDD